ncbi:MAG: PA14 domain-containing protein, partial [Candidatus Binatia bacterium]
CLVIGAAFRLYRIRSMPPGVWVDETNIAIDALKILDGRPDSPFWVGWWETPTLYAYFMAGLFKLGGVGFWSLKAASLLPALLTVAAIYPVGLLLFGPRAALLATFLLAVSRWHVTLSRWGFNELMPPFFQLAATALLLYAFVSRRALHFVLAGLVLGLGMYTYLASRLVVGVIAAYVFYRIIFERGFLRCHFAGLLLFGLSYLLCFGPLCMTYAQSSFTLLNRSRQVSILNDVQRAGSLQPIVANAERHLLMFHARGDGNWRHNLAGRPMLSLLPGVLLFLGVGLTMRRLTDHRFALLLLWIVITLQGGILSMLSEGPQAYRTLAVVPAVCLLGAVTAEAWVRVVGQSRQLRAAAVSLLVVALGYTSYATYHVYFTEQATDPASVAVFSPVENAVVRRLRAEQRVAGNLSHVYLSPRFYQFSPVRFFFYRPVQDGHGGVDDPQFHIIEPQADLPLSVDAARDVLLLLEVGIAQSLDLLKRYYPHVSSRVVRENGMRLYSEVRIPKEDLSEIQGLTAVDARGKPVPGSAHRAGSALAARLTALRPGEALVGALRAPRSGLYEFRIRAPLMLAIDGAQLHHSIVLGQGLHDLRISRRTGSGEAMILMQAPHGEFAPLDSRHLFRLSAPEEGLRGRYYKGKDWQGAPVFERVDPVLSFTWPGNEPMDGPFSIRWDGQLRIEEAGTYFFEAGCDDGCALTLDGKLVAAALREGANVIRGSRDLAPGRHEISIDYFQAGGGKAIRVFWAPPKRGRELIPARVLIPAPLDPPRTDARAQPARVKQSR